MSSTACSKVPSSRSTSSRIALASTSRTRRPRARIGPVVFRFVYDICLKPQSTRSQATLCTPWSVLGRALVDDRSGLPVQGLERLVAGAVDLGSAVPDALED